MVRAQLAQSILARIDQLWSGAMLAPDYQARLRSALLPPKPLSVSSANSFPSLTLVCLPSLCCEAAGGSASQAETVAAAWLLVYAAANLFDKIEDHADEVEIIAQVGPGAAANIATGLMVSANFALSTLSDLVIAQAIQADFYRTGLQMCAAQHVELGSSYLTLDRCWQLAQARSGIFFGLACRSGARFGSPDAARLDLFEEFGYHLGILIKVLDDLSGLESKGHHSDLIKHPRRTLPVAYFMAVVSDSERQRMERCLQAAATDPNAEAEAHRQILDSGAVLYLNTEAEKHYRQAERALKAAARSSSTRDELLGLLTQLAGIYRI